MKKNFIVLAVIIVAISTSLYIAISNNTNTELTENNSINTENENESINTDSIMNIDIKYLLGQFEPSTDTNFTLIPLPYANRNGLYAEKRTYTAFVEMCEAAKEDDITLVIVSACRNFNSQKGIWEAKWNGNRIVEGQNLAKSVPDHTERAKKILRYSSMPGTSRHHWGTDIDINSVSNSYFQSGNGKKVYEWLDANAADFGFYQVYIPKGEKRPYGYEEEPWHWTYFPVSKEYISSYKNKVTYDDITGFSGAETAKEIEVIKYYVLGINPVCL
jgi:zinc D-Ala-D-Ala carboxypeptidase